VSRKKRIEDRLGLALGDARIDVVDESHSHNVPAGAESHFKVVVVSQAFSGVSRVERHRLVHGALSEEFAGGLHALTLTLRTPQEHDALGVSIASPACLGGSKAEA
jgi:BolA protein